MSAAIASQQVNWLSVHDYVMPALDRAGWLTDPHTGRPIPSWPMVGTPEWEAADDRTKVAAMFDAAQHWALRVETSQQSMVDASKAVAAAADWASISRPRGNAYIPRSVSA